MLTQSMPPACFSPQHHSRFNQQLKPAAPLSTYYAMLCYAVLLQVALIAEEITGIGNALQRQLLRTRRSFTSTVLSADGEISGCLSLPQLSNDSNAAWCLISPAFRH